MKKAVLLIHGLAGGTYDLESLTNYLEVKGFDTFTFTLPGHDVKKKVTNKEWLDSCETNLKQIINSGYKEIYVVGHSMGGVLAIRLAAKYKEVKKVVVASAAFKHILSDKKYISAAKKTPEIIKNYSLNVVLDRFRKLHPSCLTEFLNLVNNSNKYLKKVTCPILIVQGMNDDLVPYETAFHIYNSVNSKIKKLLLCDDCNHHVFQSNNKVEINKYIGKFLKQRIYLKKKSFKNM